MIKPEDLLFMGVTSNMLEDVLINNQTKVNYDIRRDINTALKAINRVTSKLCKEGLIDLLDQYTDEMTGHYNRLYNEHNKQN